METKRLPKAEPVRSVSRALSILSAFVDLRPPRRLSLSEISKRCELSLSTAHRMVTNMEATGFLTRDPDTDTYALGPMVVLLGRVALDQAGLGSAALAVMKALSERAGESVNMAIRQGNRALYIQQVLSPHVLRTDHPVGAQVPLHCTAVGKVLLAHCPEPEVDRIVAEVGLERYTANTITEIGHLKKQLAEIRYQGYSVDDEEFLPGVHCTGAPIRNERGEVVAAIAVTGPAQRFTMDRVEAVRPDLMAAVEQISRSLGWYRGL